MNTDKGFVVDYEQSMTTTRVRRIREYLQDIDPSDVDQFIERVRHPVNAYRSNMKAHATIPDARDQQRFLDKLETKLRRLNNHVSTVSVLLDEAPIDFKRKAIAAEAPIRAVQADLHAMMGSLQEVAPSKSKYRPEVGKAVTDIAGAFEKAFGTAPAVRVSGEPQNEPLLIPLPNRFVILLTCLLDISADHASRLARFFLAS